MKEWTRVSNIYLQRNEKQRSKENIKYTRRRSLVTLRLNLEYSFKVQIIHTSKSYKISNGGKLVKFIKRWKVEKKMWKEKQKKGSKRMWKKEKKNNNNNNKQEKGLCAD